MLSMTLHVSLSVDPGFKYFSGGPAISAFDSVTSSFINNEILG